MKLMLSLASIVEFFQDLALVVNSWKAPYFISFASIAEFAMAPAMDK
jgi:hypothetical protein